MDHHATLEREIPAQFFENLRRRIRAHTPNKSAFGMDCWEWSGTMKKGSSYGVVHLSVKGDHMKVHAHRASFIAFNNKFIFPYDISHCCHNSQCVNPDHLSHEPHSINMDRERFGHSNDGEHLKSCIIGPKLEE